LTNFRNSNKPIVSVVVAVKNGAVNLQRCIDSCINQTYSHFEIVIMDGGSVDGTIDIIRANADRIAYWESRSDRGIAHAWNRALRHTTGEWIIFLGSDDYFNSPAVLDTFSNKIASHSLQNGRVIYAQVNLVSLSGEIQGKHGFDWPIICSIFFSEKMMIPHQSCFHHHSVFQEFGLFDEDFSIAADYEFLLRILHNENPFFLPQFTVADMSIGGLSSQVSTLLVMQKEFDKALKKNGLKPKGYKRMCNIVIYRILGVIIKYTSENTAKVFLDACRVVLGKRPVWTNR
jgi:glycosyltransferase involved in cell wall biosynthesis